MQKVFSSNHFHNSFNWNTFNWHNACPVKKQVLETNYCAWTNLVQLQICTYFLSASRKEWAWYSLWFNINCRIEIRFGLGLLDRTSSFPNEFLSGNLLIKLLVLILVLSSKQLELTLKNDKYMRRVHELVDNELIHVDRLQLEEPYQVPHHNTWVLLQERNLVQKFNLLLYFTLLYFFKHFVEVCFVKLS